MWTERNIAAGAAYILVANNWGVCRLRSSVQQSLITPVIIRWPIWKRQHNGLASTRQTDMNVRGYRLHFLLRIKRQESRHQQEIIRNSEEGLSISIRGVEPVALLEIYLAAHNLFPRSPFGHRFNTNEKYSYSGISVNRHPSIRHLPLSVCDLVTLCTDFASKKHAYVWYWSVFV